MRKFIIGDIHGCYDELIEFTKMVGLTADDLLISVGDIVDRGNKSKEVYQYFLNRPNSIVIAGNHERKHQKRILSYSQEIVKLQFGEEYEDFLKWTRSLAYFYETEEAIIVHAFFEHDKPLQEQKQEVLCGSTTGSKYLEKKYPNEEIWTSFYAGAKPIIYGHHVVGEEVKIINNTYGIDTGACIGGYLTAIELPGFIIHRVKAKANYWKAEQKKWQIPVLKAKNWSDMEFEEIEKRVNKLAYIEATEIKDYLHELKTWKEMLENSIVKIKEEIDILTKELLATHPDDFNLEASKLSFKNFVFKSKANNLSIADLKKGLNTPGKVIEITRQLNVLNHIGKTS